MKPSDFLRLQASTRTGYHFIIFEDGSVFKANPIDNIIGHCRGHNRDSIGIAYVGGLDDKGVTADTRTEAQRATLRTLLLALLQKYPVPIYGHRHYNNSKVCPCFDADTEYRDLLHTLTPRSVPG